MAPFPKEKGIERLAEIAAYVRSDDPITIGAAYLLELSGYVRNGRGGDESSYVAPDSRPS